MLKKYKQTWDKIIYNSENEFDSQTVHSDKYIENKVRSYNGKITTDFHNSGKPKDGSCCICFSKILINSVFELGKSYYPQHF